MNKKYLTLLLFVSLPCFAIDKEQIAKCGSTYGETARLECYDKLADSLGLLQVKPSNSTSSNQGKWRFSSSKNPVDDSKTEILMLEASAGANRYGEPVTLILRCKSNETELYVSWDDYLGRNNQVLHRIGNKEAKVTNWTLSTDSKATFKPNSIPFIKEMLMADKLVLQVTPYNESPVTAIFDTSGLDQAIKTLRETCRW